MKNIELFKKEIKECKAHCYAVINLNPKSKTEFTGTIESAWYVEGDVSLGGDLYMALFKGNMENGVEEFTYMKGCLKLVEKYLGEEVAKTISKVGVIEKVKEFMKNKQ